jgi:hypothetical protein
MRVSFISSAVVIALFASACAPHAAPAVSVASSPTVQPSPANGESSAVRPVYRLDFAVTSSDARDVSPDGIFTMNLEENDVGEIHSGTNIALSNARMDVGLLLKASYKTTGDDLLLQSSTELSGTDEPGTIRKLTAHGDALVVPGKPTLVTSIADSAGHKRYELTVTATKLR